MDSRTTAADEARAQHARIEERVAERRDGTAHPDTSTPDEEMLAAGTLPLSEYLSMLEFLRQVASTLKLKGLTATTTWTWANVKEMAGDEESRECSYWRSKWRARRARRSRMPSRRRLFLEGGVGKGGGSPPRRSQKS